MSKREDFRRSVEKARGWGTYASRIAMLEDMVLDLLIAGDLRAERQPAKPNGSATWTDDINRLFGMVDDVIKIQDAEMERRGTRDGRTVLERLKNIRAVLGVLQLRYGDETTDHAHSTETPGGETGAGK